MASNETTYTPVAVTVRTQGGQHRPGVAIGRKGKSLLVRYTIASGESRERWFGPSRYRHEAADVESLPRYVDRVCPKAEIGAELDLPKFPDHVRHPSKAWSDLANEECRKRNEFVNRFAHCDECGEDHHVEVRGDGYRIGVGRTIRVVARRSLKLGTFRADEVQA